MKKVKIESSQYTSKVVNRDNNKRLLNLGKEKVNNLFLYNFIPIIGIGIEDSTKIGGITSLLFLFILLSLAGSNKINIKVGGTIFILTLFLTNIFSFLGIFDKWFIEPSFLLHFYFIYKIIGIFFIIWGILILRDYFKFKKAYKSTFFIPMPIIFKSKESKQNLSYTVILLISITIGILCGFFNSFLLLNKTILLKFSFFIMIKDYINAMFILFLYNIGFIMLHVILFLFILYIYKMLKKEDSLLIKYSIYVRLIGAALFISSGIGFIYLFWA